MRERDNFHKVASDLRVEAVEKMGVFKLTEGKFIAIPITFATPSPNPIKE
jgi:hypothetical protein